jgi:hypothetical protein
MPVDDGPAVTQLLDILEWLLHDLRLPYVRLDGSTPVPERLATVDTCAPMDRAACMHAFTACNSQRARREMPSIWALGMPGQDPLICRRPVVY